MVAPDPLITIIGETASGKSALAIELAEQFNGEIICADSRTIYKGLDIGTAKPSIAIQERISHHLISIIEPDQVFSAADFKGRAIKAAQDIQGRGKLPIMVGGTGLYIDAVLFDFAFSPVGSEKDPKNPRHLKKLDIPKDSKKMRPNTLIIGLEIKRTELRKRIIKRTNDMLEAGLLDEVRGLSNQYGWGAPSLQSIGYREFQGFLQGNKSLEETKLNIISHTLQYAKRQRTWFKRNKSIQWVNNPRSSVEIVTTFLNKTIS